jgi:hypothetical protein
LESALNSTFTRYTNKETDMNVILDCGCMYEKEDFPNGGGYVTRNHTYCAEHQAQIDAQAAQMQAERDKETAREMSRKLWENYYVEQCRLLGLSDRATTEQIQAALTAQKNAAIANNDIAGAMAALEKGVEMLATINAITQNGGRWDTIEYHPELNPEPTPEPEPAPEPEPTPEGGV